MARRREVFVSKRQRSTVTTRRQLAKMKPRPLQATKTRPVWDKAISLDEDEKKRKKKRWEYSEAELYTDNDKLVQWAEQLLAAGKLRGFR